VLLAWIRVYVGVRLASDCSIHYTVPMTRRIPAALARPSGGAISNVRDPDRATRALRLGPHCRIRRLSCEVEVGTVQADH
jgi:hypothetical protein